MNESNISLANVSNSSVNNYCRYWEPDSNVEKIAKRTAYVLITVVGISLNIFIIIVAAKLITVRKNFHYLIINMAVSDALFLFMVLLYEVPWLSDFKWSINFSGTLGLIIDVTLRSLKSISFRVSLITLLIIAIERFRATRKTLQQSGRYSLKRRVLLVGISWLIPLPVALPYALRPSRIVHENDISSYITRIYAILIVILCCAIVVLSILTTRRLSKPQAIQANISEERQNIRKRRTLAAIRMVLASALLYPCCWIPYFFFLVAEEMQISLGFLSDCLDLPSLFFITDLVLPVVNSCFSPFIYLICLPDFRKATKKVLCRQDTVNQASDRGYSIELATTHSQL